MRAILLVAAAAALIAGPAAAQSSIRVGQTLSGELSASDPSLNDGSYFDCYALRTQTGQKLQVDQTSAAFDSYLSLVRGGCSNPTDVLANDDDSGGGLNSRILRDGDGGVWGVVVNSLQGGSTGAYQLRVSSVSGEAASVARPAAPDPNAPPSARPAGGLQRYTWDLICLAADNYWKINAGGPSMTRIPCGSCTRRPRPAKRWAKISRPCQTR